ncbi:FecCD family ABC transporter permease [Pseudokineococcus sp. 1T1Z-3]|uniref:FecCD family ABC transporter permease n=1 Tax=Pseudokineococcus sp. 1T1Z-3 TaxID=3132745 RepID=UPI0030ACEEFF
MSAVREHAAPPVGEHRGRTPDRPRVDPGHRVLRVRAGRLQARVPVRTLLVTATLGGLTLALAVVGLGVGDVDLPPVQVLSALLGGGEDLTRLVVVEWRLPRVLAAVVFGAALGVSGGIFQSLTRNPLASPDVIGFAAGSYTGALLVVVTVGGGYALVAGGALVGGVLTAAAVYLLAYRRGVAGFRLVVVGIGVSAMLGSLNTFLLLRADLEVALSAATWGAGTLSSTGWSQVLVGGATVLVLLVVVASRSGDLRQLELGDDAARATGVHAEPARLVLVVAGVALVAAVTAAAGPIAFVALAAPQIARRVMRTAGTTLVGAAAVGALVLLAADLVAQHVLPTTLPVGVVTVVVGGAYLVWLLVREARRRL